jgi:ketosteroid isomerase-like protein
MPGSLDQRQRFVVFALNAATFYILYVWATGHQLLTDGPESLWFDAAIASWTLSLLSAPFFRPPKDAIGAGVAALLVLVATTLPPERGKPMIASAAALALLAAPASAAPTASTPKPDANFTAIAELRAAEAHLIADLEGEDRLAWVGDYTADAVFQEGDAAPVSGRAALTALARTLGTLTNVRIIPVRTEVSGRLAYVQVRGTYGVGKAAPERFQGVMIWRRDRDGTWRMLHEMLAKDTGK